MGVLLLACALGPAGCSTSPPPPPPPPDVLVAEVTIIPVSFYVVERLRGGREAEAEKQPPSVEPEPPAVAGARGS